MSRERSAYRLVDGVIVPLTSEEELAEVEATIQHAGLFALSSQHIKEAVRILSDRESPNARNAIKESISAVEAAIGVASGNPKASISKGLQKLALHPQLEASLEKHVQLDKR